MIERADLVIIGCGPAGGTAAREAARNGVSTVVLEKDLVVGAKRVCAAGLRPGFCETFDLPRELVHCDTPRLALFDADGTEHEIFFGPGHTSTREELDGEIGRLAAAEGAEIRTGMLYRGFRRYGDRVIVEYADTQHGERKQISARNLFLAQGATASLDYGLRPTLGMTKSLPSPFAFDKWHDGMLTTLQYRVYPDRPAAAVAYETLELHYYLTRDARQVVAWMFPKRDHLAIGLGVRGKMPGKLLREELALFTDRVAARLYPSANVTMKEEGHLLYGGWPRPRVEDGAVMVGGTAAGLVDATNGEGIFEAAMSGRLVAEAIDRHRDNPLQAAARYGQQLHARFRGRLERRVRLMHFLERRPRRFQLLFEQLAAAPAFASALMHENHERSFSERAVLVTQALRFFTRASIPNM